METTAPGSTFTHTAHWGAFNAVVQDGRLVGVKPFEGDPDPSPLLETIPSAIYHETRIAQPMVRKGYLERGIDSDRAARGAEPFVPVPWDQALDLVAGELARVKREHGNEAIFASSGWASPGTFHNARNQFTRFFNCFGGFVDQVTNYSFGAATVIVPRVVGSLEPVVGPHNSWPTIAEHTELMVLFGGMAPKNLQVNQGGVARHDAPDLQRKIVDAGVKFVSISPLRDDTRAALKAEWLAIRPNTDTAMMLALAHTLLAEGLHDEGFLATHCVGFERFEPYLLGETDGQAKDADWAAAITGIPAETTRALARRMAASRTLITVSWSVQRADHGEQPYWAAIALAAMLGQIGLPGGGVGFGYGAIHGIGMPRRRAPIPKLPVGENPVAEFIPVARITDMLLDPGGAFEFNGQHLRYPDTRLMYWSGGNPFHKQQDINRLLRGWRYPETIVVHEPWWTPAARRADIVLPATTTLERNDIGASAYDSHFIAMKQAIAPVGEAKSDHEIFARLAERLGFAAQFTEGRDEMAWLRHLYEVAQQQAAQSEIDMPGFEAFWRDGHFEIPVPADPPIPFSAFRDDPAAHPLKTPSGRIEIFSETISSFGYDDCPGHPAWLEPAEWLGADKAKEYPLHMLSNQPRHRLHSQMDPGDVSQGAKVAGREPVRINTADAAARGIADGDVVRLYNDRGECLAGAVVTDDVSPGVIMLATGGWYDPADAGVIGALDKQGNPNVLTLDKGTSRLAQTSVAQTALVEVERYAGAAPAVGVYKAPAVA
jgi:biotin/methionine sulfoxide reductase